MNKYIKFDLFRLLLTLFAMVGCLAAAPHIAKADTIDTMATIFDAIHQTNHDVPSGSDIRGMVDLFTCLDQSGGDSDQILGCVATFSSQHPDNPYLSTLADFIKLYAAIKSGDYWGIVGCVAKWAGESAPCIVVDIVQPELSYICGIYTELAKLFDLVANEILQFFEDIADAIWQGLKDAYCATLGHIFGGCDDDSPPPSTAQVLYDNIYAPRLEDGLAAMKDSDDAFKKFLSSIRPHDYAHADIDQAEKEFTQLVDAAWTSRVQPDLMALASARSNFENSQSIQANIDPIVAGFYASGKAEKDYTKLWPPKPEQVMQPACVAALDSDSTVKSADRWITKHSSKAQDMQLVGNVKWCNDFAHNHAGLFAQRCKYYMDNDGACPFKQQKYTCGSIQDFFGCIYLTSAMGLSGACAPDTAAIGAGYCQNIISMFKAKGSNQDKYPCSCNQGANPVSLDCVRPMQGMYCKQFYGELTDHYNMSQTFLKCNVNEDPKYTVLKGQVVTAVGTLNQEFTLKGYGVNGDTFTVRTGDPLLVLSAIPVLEVQKVRSEIEKPLSIVGSKSTAPQAKLSSQHVSGAALASQTDSKSVTDAKAYKTAATTKTMIETSALVNKSSVSFTPCYENFNVPPSDAHCFAYSSQPPKSIDGVITPLILDGMAAATAQANHDKEMTTVTPESRLKKIAGSANVGQALEEQSREPLIGHGDIGDYGGAGGKKPLDGSQTRLVEGQEVVITSADKMAKYAAPAAGMQTQTFNAKEMAISGAAASQPKTGAAAAAAQAQTQVASLTLLPDITCMDQPKIAGNPVQWGGNIAVDAGKAESRNNGLCSFQIEYSVRNMGKAPAAGFRGLWTNSAVIGNWPQSFAPIGAGGMNSQKIVLPLKPGVNQLLLSLDDLRQVQESNEANNQFHLLVNITGNCDSGCRTCPGASPQLPLRSVPQPSRH